MRPLFFFLSLTLESQTRVGQEAAMPAGRPSAPPYIIYELLVRLSRYQTECLGHKSPSGSYFETEAELYTILSGELLPQGFTEEHHRRSDRRASHRSRSCCR